jgi:hypothetical protein
LQAKNQLRHHPQLERQTRQLSPPEQQAESVQIKDIFLKRLTTRAVISTLSVDCQMIVATSHLSASSFCVAVAPRIPVDNEDANSHFGLMFCRLPFSVRTLKNV